MKKQTKKEAENEKPRICHLCGKEITIRDGEPVYVKTKRGSEFFMHTECIKNGL